VGVVNLADLRVGFGGSHPSIQRCLGEVVEKEDDPKIRDLRD
jgi:hypothetical protein